MQIEISELTCDIGGVMEVAIKIHDVNAKLPEGQPVADFNGRTGVITKLQVSGALGVSQGIALVRRTS